MIKCLSSEHRFVANPTLQVKTILVAMATKILGLATKFEPRSKIGRKD